MYASILPVLSHLTAPLFRSCLLPPVPWRLPCLQQMFALSPSLHPPSPLSTSFSLTFPLSLSLVLLALLIFLIRGRLSPPPCPFPMALPFRPCNVYPCQNNITNNRLSHRHRGRRRRDQRGSSLCSGPRTCRWFLGGRRRRRAPHPLGHARRRAASRGMEMFVARFRARIHRRVVSDLEQAAPGFAR